MGSGRTYVGMRCLSPRIRQELGKGRLKPAVGLENLDAAKAQLEVCARDGGVARGIKTYADAVSRKSEVTDGMIDGAVADKRNLCEHCEAQEELVEQ